MLLDAALAQLAVGAYRIRPNASTYPRECLQGVCDTPLRGMFVEYSFNFDYLYIWIISLSIS